jgi:hypothetical protein
MENKNPKYSIGDILQHNEDEHLKREILCIYTKFYDETGISKEIYYCTQNIVDTSYPPSPIKESALNKYYTKITKENG